MNSFWIKTFLALLLGTCVPLALAPFDIWPLMFVGVAGFYWLTLTAHNQKQAIWFGWIYGCGYFCIGVSWIYGSMQTVDTPIWLSLILTGGFCLLMALFHLFQSWFFFRYLKNLPFVLLTAAPVWWVINEWIREWFLTGMPWLYAGYALSYTPSSQLAAVTGIYGLSVFVAFMSAFLLQSLLSYLDNRTVKSLRWSALAISMFILLNLSGLWLPAETWTQSTRTITAAAVQSNVDQKTKWAYQQQLPTFEFYGNSIEKMTDVDFILWPEAALTRLPDQIPNFVSQVENIGTQRDQAIVTGILTHKDGRYYNSLLGYGTADGTYLKQHLVPFGEYVPLEKFLRGLIAFFDLPTSTMYPAPEKQLPLSVELEGEPYFVAGVICYEAAYPEIVRELAVNANLIAVVSNDAWFGDSIGPHQHLQITQMRAIENGRAIVRATQNGVSALIDANGKLVQHSDQFVVAELIGELELRTGLTPFQRMPAQMPAYLCLLILAGLIGLNKKRKTT